MKTALKKELIKYINTNIKNQRCLNEPLEQTATDGEVINFAFMTRSHDARAGNFETPLISALIRTSSFTLATSLINEGGSVNTKDSAGNTPLYYAINKANVDLIHLIAERGGDTKVVTFHQPTDLDDDPMTVWNVPSSISIAKLINGTGNWTDVEKANGDAATWLHTLLGDSGSDGE
jgi:hypothetical protein